MTNLPFIKMNGLGNDFVILDARDGMAPLSEDKIIQISNRRFGVGCDQLIILDKPEELLADVFMRIYNADGSEAAACGNATRCVAKHLGLKSIKIQTIAGLLAAEMKEDGLVEVNMGQPRMDWQDIPLLFKQDTLHVDLEVGVLRDPVAVNIGNPHIVFFVDDIEKIDVTAYGSQIETLPLFPDRVNVSFAQILERNEIRLRVWERGAGLTASCGTAACASTVAAHLRGLTERDITVHLDGGDLFMRLNERDEIIMTGSADLNFEGVLQR
ncbi:MAG: diaminopimelate epimerase [Alphaproteobacteria bacterium]